MPNSSRDSKAGTSPFRKRADARRNAERLLEAAGVVFAAHGPDASLDEVARRAGVGNATLYRHFPTRQDLLIAVYAEEVAALTALADGLDGPDALWVWLEAFIVVASKRDLAHAIPEGRARSTLFDDWHAAMHATAETLLGRAQASGEVRADVDAADLMTVANGLALAGAADHAPRLLALLRDGVATHRRQDGRSRPA